MTTTSRTKEGTDDDGGLIGRQLNSCTLGTDGDGYTHVWHRGANQIVVHRGRELDYRQHLGDRPLGDWMAHVEEARGWMTTGPFAAAARKADRARKERESR
jgi:hypothetical protein